MAFELKIKNFGKLSDAEIRIGRLTVFAGSNNTGKSSVSKLLYSLFNAMNAAGDTSAHFDDLTYEFRRKLRSFEGSGDGNRESPLRVLNDEMNSIKAVFESLSFKSSEETEEQWERIMARTERLYEIYCEFRRTVEKTLPGRKVPGSHSSKHLDETEEELHKLGETVENSGARELVETSLRQNIFRNLTENFQVRNLSFLRARPDELSEVRIDGIGSFEFSGERDVSFSLERRGLVRLRDRSRAIYLESPVCWKLKSALEDIRKSLRFPHGRRRLNGAPGYFHDLAWALVEEGSGAVLFEEVYEKLVSERVMGGKLVISETKGPLFLENGCDSPSSVAAMGTAGLGMLALLIEHGIVEEGAFLFIDEPEAHLHPAWEVEIADALLELSRSGINVVMATHSMNIMKYLQVKAKKDPQIKELVALNHFSSDGVENCEDGFDSTARNILIELTEPYSGLYMEGL